MPNRDYLTCTCQKLVIMAYNLGEVVIWGSHTVFAHRLYYLLVILTNDSHCLYDNLPEFHCSVQKKNTKMSKQVHNLVCNPVSGHGEACLVYNDPCHKGPQTFYKMLRGSDLLLDIPPF